MKKISLICLLSLVSYAAQAQFSLTPKVGVGFSNVTFSEEANKIEGKKSRTGILFGLGANYAFTEAFSLQAELLFNSKGYKAEETSGGSTVKANFSLNYLEIPILARYAFGNENFKTYVNAGPYVAFGLGGKAKAEGSIGGISLTTETKIKFGKEPDNYTGSDLYVDNGFDFGVQAGAGILYKVGPGSLNLDLRYGLGLSNLNDESTGNNVKIKADGKNNQFAVSVGYQFPLGSK